MIGAVARKKDSTATPPYLSRLKFREPPFAPNSGPGFFYADPDREQLLNMLLHLTQYSEELLLVTGTAGAGKTALLEKYLSRADDHWQICRIEGGDATEADKLFLRIAECFHLDTARVAPDRLLEALSSHLAQLHQQMTPVLVIDDAHRLSDDALEIALRLATLEGEHGRLIRVTLAADPSLLDRLAGSRFEAIPDPHRLELKPFDDEHTGAYLNHRLRAAGYSGTTPFTARHIKRIFKASHGLPDHINREAHRVLNEIAGTEGIRLDRRYLKPVLGILGLLVAAVLLREPVASRLFAPENPSPQPPTTRPAQNGSQPIVRETTGAPAAANGSRPQVTLASGDKLLVSCDAPETRGVAPKPATAQPESVSGETVASPADSVAASAPRLVRIDPNPVIGSETAQKVVVRGDNLTPVGNVAVSSGEGARVLKPQQIEAVDAQTLRLTFNTGSRPDHWAVQVTREDGKRSNVVRFDVVAPIEEAPEEAPGEPEPTAGIADATSGQSSQAPETAGDTEASAQVSVPPPVVAPEVPATHESPPESAPPAPVATPRPQSDVPADSQAAKREPPPPVPAKPEATEPRTPTIRGAEWLRSLPNGHFTVQLAAARQRESIIAFIRGNRLDGPLAVYSTRRGARPLLVLVQGDYPSRAGAEQAVQELPAAIRRGDPWVRPVETILSEIVVARDSPLSKGAAWLWGRNPGNWTVQLAAAATPEAARDTVAGRDLVPLALAEAQRGGKPWYELLYGDFSTRQEAMRAIGKLPSSIKAAGPWPRRFGDIQAELAGSDR